MDMIINFRDRKRKSIAPAQSLTATLLICIFFATPTMVCAQDKIAPRVTIAYHQTNDTAQHLIVLIRKKIEKRFEPVEAATARVSVEFADRTDEAGVITTNSKGEGKIILENKLAAALITADDFTFTVDVAETPATKAASESVTLKPCRLRIEAGDDKSISVLFQAKEDGQWQPVEGAEMKVVIMRTFGQLDVADESYSTDENGEATLAFDTEIPGDENGFITLACIIEDSEEFGNVVATTRAPWGTPLKQSDEFNRRTLWATRDKTPLWLLIFPNAIIAGVWGVIFYLVVLLFKMQRARAD